MNQYRRIFNILIEGLKSGDDLEATFERLGRHQAHSELNPKAERGEPGYLRKMSAAKQKKRRIRLNKKIVSRTHKREVAKNKATKANQPTMRDVHSRDSEGILRFDPDAAKKKGKKPGTAKDIEDVQRQEGERKDFKLSMGDTSELSSKELKKELVKWAAASKERGRRAAYMGEGKTSGGDAEATGERLGRWAVSGKKRDRSSGITDMEKDDEGVFKPVASASQKKALLKVRKRIANRAKRTASANRDASLERRRHYGGATLVDLAQGLKPSDSESGIVPLSQKAITKSPGTVTGSRAQSDRHVNIEKEAGRKASIKASSAFAAGLARGGVTFKPGSKMAIASKRHSTQKTADELKAALRAEKHATSQAAGSTTQKVPSTLRRRRLKAVSRSRRERAQVFGDPKKGYADADKDPTMRNLMNFQS